MAEGKNYLGKGWHNEQFDLTNISLEKAKILELPTDKYGMVKITVSRMKKVDTKSKATHTVFENTYKKSTEENPFE